MLVSSSRQYISSSVTLKLIVHSNSYRNKRIVQNNYITIYMTKACLKEVRLGEPVTECGREFHRVTGCGAKEHMSVLYLSSMAGVGGDSMNRRVPV